MATGRARETHVPPDPGPSSRVARVAGCRSVPAGDGERLDGERIWGSGGRGRPAPGAAAGPRVPRAARYSRSPTLAPREIAARGGRTEPEAVPVGGAPLFYLSLEYI